MPTDEPGDRDEAVHQVNRMVVSGASGDVVQARDVHGGVHFHRSEPAAGVAFTVARRSCPATCAASSTASASWRTWPGL